ncbi:unnamed protein product, partial [marine sediment metagenome]
TFSEYAYHQNDADTYVRLGQGTSSDTMSVLVGNELMIAIYENGTQDVLELGDGGDIDINLNDDVMITGSNSRLGIGTINPQALFSVEDAYKEVLNLWTASNVEIMTDSSGSTASAADRGAALMLGGTYATGSTNTVGFGGIGGYKENATTSNLSGYLTLYTSVSGTGTVERVRVTSAGKVGVNTSAPDGVLEVNLGTAGLFQLSYNDANGSAANRATFGLSSAGALTITTVDASAAAGNIVFDPDGIVVSNAIFQVDAIQDVGNDATLSFSGTNGVDVVNAFTAGSVASDAAVSGTTITASTGFALGNADYIGITGNEIITFNEAGTINFTGASVDVDGAFTAGSVVSDADVTGATVASITAANLVDKSAVEAVTGDWTFDGNHPVEGYTTGRNVMRSIRLTIT